MKLIRMTIFAGIAAALAACSGAETPTRNAPLDISGFGPDAQIVARSYAVQSVNYAAPDDLKVSERNSYYPFTDIVWRGDPVGDRKAQIGDLFQTAAKRGVMQQEGAVPVVLDIELIRFHGVTERVRFSVGGNYNIVFWMTVRDAQTGLVIEDKRKVALNLSAPGGAAAILADQRGQTEKVRVTDFLTYALQDALRGEVVL